MRGLPKIYEAMIKGEVLFMPIGDEKEHQEFMRHVEKLAKEIIVTSKAYAVVNDVQDNINAITMLASKIIVEGCIDFMKNQIEKENMPNEGAMPSFETTRAEA